MGLTEIILLWPFASVAATIVYVAARRAK